MTAENSPFENTSYINLETYRKDKQSVKTPVWFVQKNNTIYVVTKEKTGKVKRIKNNSEVKIAPCDYKGTLKGKWVSGRAHIVDSLEKNDILKSRNEKYGFKAKIANLISFNKGSYLVIAIQT
ncbi:PPOX class F420-dependent oxidoreductase [Candidatus Nitrosocosmicus hydrocola]|uniref:PPOX class F420-dependent oxidoreductase n=1 Tax=Candidatus Nitrosocosmicus hydrocola TaxID=1826872 RepID=UPI0011E58AA9|nr:PPOX class F420-dependent oxidoreductase [Candidatus Nitrosocosmicus hydrocola]